MTKNTLLGYFLSYFIDATQILKPKHKAALMGKIILTVQD